MPIQSKAQNPFSTQPDQLLIIPKAKTLNAGVSKSQLTLESCLVRPHEDPKNNKNRMTNVLL